MATNYTFAQVCKIINEGTNTEALVDIGKRFPLLMHKVTQVTAVAGDKFVDLMNFMPDYVTANKINGALKSGIPAGDTNESDENEATETEAADEATESTASGDMPDYEKMKNKELKAALEAAGAPVPKSLKRCDLLAACKAMHEGGNTEDEEEDEEAAEESNPYDGKSAPDLYKECKKRGIKAQPKKPAKYYVDLLLKADAEQAAAEANAAEAEDWGDDEEAEEEAPKSGKKSGKKDAPKPAKKDAPKAGKKAAKNEDEDDDWDI